MPPHEFTILPALLALHKIDGELQELSNRRHHLVKDQLALQHRITELQAAVAETESAERKLQATIAAHELDMKARQEHVEKMRQSLNTTKTNKEYSAILVQISTDKVELDKVETAALELMDQQQKNAQNLQNLRRQLDTAQATLAGAQQQNAAQVAAVDDELQACREARRQAMAKVPHEALRQYERIGKKYPGQALAPVEYREKDLDTITCGGCFMSLNIEDINLLRGRDEVRHCHSCGRILYLPEMVPHDLPSSV